MPSNELHHGYTLTSLFIEAKYAKWSRRWARYGRNGETPRTSWARDARKAYNKAHRKSARVQLSRYQVPSEEPIQQELDMEYYAWEDDRYQSDMGWTISNEERRFNEAFFASQDLDWEYAQHP